jgi:uncharacterized protein (TIGR02001 family)
MLDIPPPVPSIEFNLASTGMSKGLAQTDGPQAVVRGELAFGSLYLGAYAKNVDSSSSDGEAAALIGFRTKAGGFDLSASAAWKRAIHPAADSDADALEVSAAIARPMAAFTPRVSIVWSPDDLGSTGHTIFAEAGASYRMAKTLTASAAIGRRERQGGADYTAWNAGLSWVPAKRVALDLRYYDTDGGNTHPFKARVVATARLKF